MSWNPDRRNLHRAGWQPCGRRRACRPGPVSRRRRTHIPSRSAARWRPARTTPRCPRVRSDAGSWLRPATALTKAAASPARPQGRMPGAARKSLDQCSLEKSWDRSRTLLLAFRRGVLDQVAGHRALLVEPFLRRVADLFGGDGANAIRPASDIVDAQ